MHYYISTGSTYRVPGVQQAATVKKGVDQHKERGVDIVSCPNAAASIPRGDGVGLKAGRGDGRAPRGFTNAGGREM